MAVKYEIKILIGKTASIYGEWKCVHCWFIGTIQSFSGKGKTPCDNVKDDKEELDIRAHNTIQLCLTDEVLYELLWEVIDEVYAVKSWLKLESLYMTSLSRIGCIWNNAFIHWEWKNVSLWKSILTNSIKSLCIWKILILRLMMQIQLSLFCVIYLHYMNTLLLSYTMERMSSLWRMLRHPSTLWSWGKRCLEKRVRVRVWLKVFLEEEKWMKGV